jgi:chemosensory pili system protein ChpA (sensor histidine kinase/response regulator)
VRLPGGERLPLVRLGALLQLPPPPVSTSRRAVLVLQNPADFEPRRFAITCDRVIGPREIVMRSLGPLLAGLPLYSGAVVSGAGKVQLILDVATLAEEAQSGARAMRPQATHSQRRVLVADDSRSIREAATLLFTQQGWLVETVPDGQDAWELLQDRPFDLLMTDLEMPRLDGHALITRVRGSVELARLPILVVTSRTADTVRTRLEGAGADAFLGKPLRGEALVEAAERAISRRQERIDASA